MPQHPIAPIPEGYTIIIQDKKHYPAKIEDLPGGGFYTITFVEIGTRKPISYSKRAYAVSFLERYARNEISWAEPAQVTHEEREECTR